MAHTKLSDFVPDQNYNTSPNDDIALKQTGKQEAVKAVQQFHSQDFTITGYFAVIASYYAAIHGESPKAYVELLILKDMEEHGAMTEKPYQCGECHWQYWYCDADIIRDKENNPVMPCGHSWQSLEHVEVPS